MRPSSAASGFAFAPLRTSVNAVMRTSASGAPVPSSRAVPASSGRASFVGRLGAIDAISSRVASAPELGARSCELGVASEASS